MDKKQCTKCEKHLPVTLFNGPTATICAKCQSLSRVSDHDSQERLKELKKESYLKTESQKREDPEKHKQQLELADKVLAAKDAEQKAKAESQKQKPQSLPSKAKQELAKRELARRRLLPFVQYFNDRYLPGWVHKDICQKLEQFYEDVKNNKSPRLMLFMPPRSGKSELASRGFPSWVLGHDPSLEFIATSYGSDLATDFSRKVRDVISSPEYSRIFPDTKIPRDARAVEKWKTTADGSYVAVGVGGPITGRGAHIAVIDDPLKNREEAESPTTRQKIKDWYTSTLYTRLAPGGGVLLIMTRWHDDDLAGWLLEQAKEGGDRWEVVSYPAIAVQDERFRKKDEALHPERYDEKALLKIRNAIGERDWASMYQQNPVPDEGAYFQKPWFQYYAAKDRPPLEDLQIYQAWDFAIGQAETNDFTVGATIGVARDGTAYVLEVRRGRWDSLEIADQIVTAAKLWKPAMVGMEKGQIEMSIGPLIRKRMRETSTFFPIQELKTGRRDKQARARPLQGRLQQGMVLLPKDAEWATILKNEMLRFPAGVNDDQVDALAWAFQMLELFSAVVERKIKPKKSWRDNLSKYVKGSGGKRNHMTA